MEDKSINDKLCKYIIKILDIKDTIYNWLDEEEYRIKPLVIYGGPGTGKTTLANYILRDWVKIIINIDMSKSGIILEDFLNSSLYKKSITMMFSDNKYKSLIIDDLYYIQNNDKKLYKSIINFCKQNSNNHPIIYIFDIINHKSILHLINNSFKININYKNSQIKYIVKNYFTKDKKIPINELNNLINNSNKNFHNIINNINFYKKDFNIIHKYDTTENELSLFIRNILDMDNINELYLKATSDYNIIGLNILENIYDWLSHHKKINKKERVLILNNIYNHMCLGDLILNKMYLINDWSLVDHVITNTIVYPYYMIKSKKIKVLNIEYNKYISRCIIYTYNNKLLSLYNFDSVSLSYIYDRIINYIIHKKEKDLDLIKNIINHYNLTLKFLEKFLKYYSEYNIHKKIILQFYK